MYREKNDEIPTHCKCEMYLSAGFVSTHKLEFENVSAKKVLNWIINI